MGLKSYYFWDLVVFILKNASQPMKEEELLNGKLEPTNEPYAIDKL